MSSSPLSFVASARERRARPPPRRPWNRTASASPPAAASAAASSRRRRSVHLVLRRPPPLRPGRSSPSSRPRPCPLVASVRFEQQQLVAQRHGYSRLKLLRQPHLPAPLCLGLLTPSHLLASRSSSSLGRRDPLHFAKTRQPGKPKDAFADFAKYIYGRTGRLQNVYDYVGLKVPFGCAKFVYTVTRQVPLPRLRDLQERVPRRPVKYLFARPSSSTTCVRLPSPRPDRQVPRQRVYHYHRRENDYFHDVP